MIVTLTLEKINIPRVGYCCVFSKETLEKLCTNETMCRCKILYKLYINNRELQLECPVIKNPQQENIVIWPAIKLPHRKYPVHIYLYAVAIYLSSNLSMRKVAAKVRNVFGLDKFSHSTLSRSLKKLVAIVDELEMIVATDMPEYKDISCGDTLVPKRCWDTTRQDKYQKLLHLLFPVLDKLEAMKYGALLNYRYFNKTMKFLI
jgi:hypothetical protein